MNYQMTKKPTRDLTEAEKHSLYKNLEPAVGAGFTFGSASIQTEICDDALKVKYHNELEYVNKRIKEMVDIAIDLAQFKLEAATHDLIQERVKDIKQIDFRTKLAMEELETRVNAKLSECIHKFEEHKDIILRYSTGTQAVYDEMKMLKKLLCSES